LGIIHSLSQAKDSTLRFKEFTDLISGISQTELTKQLKELEFSGIISRKIYAEVPVRVEYSLEKIGVSLLDPINSLYKWAVKYGDKIKENRECKSNNNEKNEQ
jgi:DNA-binding HxlR family transcriptional regulator